MYNRWEDSLNRELAGWKAEMDELESKVPDRRLIYDNARERVLQALEAQAMEAGLLPITSRPGKPVQGRVVEPPTPLPTPSDMAGWKSLAELSERGKSDPTLGGSVKPTRIREPNGNEVPARSCRTSFCTLRNSWLKEDSSAGNIVRLLSAAEITGM